MMTIIYMLCIELSGPLWGLTLQNNSDYDDYRLCIELSEDDILLDSLQNNRNCDDYRIFTELSDDDTLLR